MLFNIVILIFQTPYPRLFRLVDFYVIIGMVYIYKQTYCIVGAAKYPGFRTPIEMTEKIISTNTPPSSSEKTPEDQVLAKRKLAIKQMYLSQGIETGAIIFTLVTLVILYWGWKADLENYITAESGLGYWLGIVGGVAMLLTFIFALRKRLKSMSKWKTTAKFWFTAHMIFGVVGPVAILFHSNFGLGSSLNEQVAMISMLIILVSGIVGRYVHDKTRYGLYKQEAALEQLQLVKLVTENELSHLNEINPDLFKNILKYNDTIKLDSSGLIKSFFRMLSLNTHTRISNALAKQDLKKACKQIATQEQWSPSQYRKTFNKANHFLTVHYSAVRKIASFSFYERLFSIWFFLHIPLFYMLIVSVIFHIIAVHMFSAHGF